MSGKSADARAQPKSAALFVTLTNDGIARVFEDMGPDTLRALAAQLPANWTSRQKADFCSALRMACFLVRERTEKSPESIVRALETIARASADVRTAIAYMQGLWGPMDERAASLVAGKGLVKVTMPSHFADDVSVLLKQLEVNAEGMKRYVPFGKDLKPETTAKQFLVDRVADAFESVDGTRLPITPPDWFLEVLRILAPGAGLKTIGRSIAKDVLRERAAAR
jgi:hypothetical protein